MSERGYPAVLVVLFAALSVHALPAGAGFEGAIRARTIVVERGELTNLLGNAEPAPDAVFAIPIDELLLRKGKPGVATGEMIMEIKGSKVRTGVPTPVDSESYAIVDVEQETTWMVLPKEQRVVEWTKADTRALGETMAKMEDAVRGRLDDLPTAQRKRVERLLNRRGGNDNGAGAVEVKPLGRTRTINGMSATGYEIRSGGEVIHGWVTAEHGPVAQLYNAVQDSIKKTMPTAPSGMRARQSAHSALGALGLPVLVQTFNTQRYVVQEVLAIEAREVPSDRMAMPLGFTKMSAMEAVRRLAGSD